MSILIKGMEMPKGCFYCPIGVEQHFTGSIRCPLLGKGVGYFDEVKNKRDMNCPLVPLPEKHGRLIDADVMVEGLMKCAKNPPDDDQESRWFYLFAAEIAKSCETIMPAEGGTEDG